MKKIFIILLISMSILTGCGTNMNSPTSAVENYLKKYQDLDGEVTSQLDSVISSDISMTDTQKNDYKELMMNQYKNMSYKIVNENLMDEEAEVEVEIEVLDYASSIGESRIYYNNHRDEFSETSEDDDSINDDEDIDNIASFIDYKIKNMKNVTNTTKETITFYLNKVDGEWVVDNLSDIDLEKLHGLYEE